MAEASLYDPMTGRLKQENPVDVAPPPTVGEMSQMVQQQPPQMRTQGRYVDVLASQGRANTFR